MNNNYDSYSAKRCWVSSKVCFSKKDCETAVNNLYKEKGVELRIYQCESCNFWHLTHSLTTVKKYKHNNKKYDSHKY